MKTLKEKLRQYREASPFQAPSEDDLLQRAIDSMNLIKNPDGTYSCDGAVVITDALVTDGKLKLKFKHVKGRFDCYSLGLTTLEGCPETVGGSFICDYNKLTTLKGAPKTVGGDFTCDYNSLTTLEHAPKEVGDEFCCANNKLTTLKGAPQKVIYTFDCSWNALTTLEHAPKEVGAEFNCRHNTKKFTVEDVTAVSNVEGPIRV